MTDACRSMRKAIRRIYSGCSRLMCYFHVAYNCKKRLKSYSQEDKEYVIATMGRLHECLFRDEFDELWPLVKDRWIKRGLDDFVEYFEKEWISGPTYKWRVYNSPIGFSTTNNPIESYNNKIRVQFTMRVLMSMKGICDLFKDVCAFECERLKEFSNQDWL